MALPIRDGNQTLTTLSTIIVNSAHVPAHSVVSLGSQAITDIAVAVSGVELGPNSISALEHISVTISAGTSLTIGNVVSVTGGLTDAELRASSVTIGGSVQVSNLPATQAVTFTQAPVTFGNIAGSVTAVISGTPSVTFTQASVTFTQASVTFGQAVVSASNIGDLLSSVATDNTLDATTKFVKIGGHQSGSNQTSHIVHVSAGGSMSVDASGSSVTFTQASVTFNSITGSVSVLNFPATQTTTFSAITGSVSVLNLPATQTVTFTQASVTFGTPVVTGSVSVLNFPATQTIAGTVTIGNFDFASTGQGGQFATKSVQVGFVSDSNSDFYVAAGEDYPFPVNIRNSVTIASLPAISGTVTANLFGYNPVNDANESLEILEIVDQASAQRALPIMAVGSLPAISGTVTANLSSGNLNSVTIGVRGVVTSGISDISLDARNQLADSIALYAEDNRGFPIRVVGADGGDVPVIGDVGVSGTVTVGNSVTANSPTRSWIDNFSNPQSAQFFPVAFDYANNQLAPIPVSDGGFGVIAVQPTGINWNISGTVTANNPNGALTTRFGSVTTANTAQITSAVTNTSRKYLLAQNISAGTVTIGIGFSPTTTQGIQLTAGGGLTFDAFCPTGAVYWLGAVTGAAFTILEG